jgi:hypothetical protein
MRFRVCLGIGLAVAARAGLAQSIVNPPPTPKQWADLAKLPDLSGVWIPATRLQYEEIAKNPTPWAPKAAEQITRMLTEEKAGRSAGGLFVDCLPEGMPTLMMITHNSLEFLVTPGRITILGESDGNRTRRIYTDGRGHPEDPDPTFHGHSIGSWNGDTLLVDTVGILPQSYIAITETIGVPNNGDMHIVEHIHLTGPDTLQDDMEITAPHVLKQTWKTSRIYYRQRAQKYDIVEGECLQGNFTPEIDKNGNAIFAPLGFRPFLPQQPK